MHKALIYYFLFLTLVFYGNHDTLYVSSKGFQNTTIGKTNIKDIITKYGNNYKLKINEYTSTLANMGSGCIHLYKTKRFYRYAKIGIIFITTDSDTISGVIFTKKANVKTAQNIQLKKLYKNKIEAIIDSDSTLSKDKSFYIKRKNQYGFSQKYSKKANWYNSVNGILYCYKKHTRLKGVNKKILEIRIGE